MPETAYRHVNDVRHRCPSCHTRNAVLSSTAEGDQPPSHDVDRRSTVVCFNCFRADRERRQAQPLSAMPPTDALSVERLTPENGLRQGNPVSDPATEAGELPGGPSESFERNEPVGIAGAVEHRESGERHEALARLERFARAEPAARLDARQIEHRRRMLAHLASVRRA